MRYYLLWILSAVISLNMALNKNSNIDFEKKRGRESEGETPKPLNKQNKMEDLGDDVSDGSTDHNVSMQLDKILRNICELKENQNNMKEMFQSKLDELTENFDSKISLLKEEISTDLNTERLRLDQLDNSVKTLKNEVKSIKESERSSVQSNELTIVAFGLQYDREEIIEEKVKRLIVTLGEQVSENVKITQVSRLNTKKGKPGIVKFSLENVDQKMLVPRNKMKPRKSDYSDVYCSTTGIFRTSSCCVL
ncbi:hypothetical protein SNE40_006327 [Patella caerulea]|uniref:Uncharacterized protein n=1 Tax=Patella caerulea TaxID=87958 RepID=A0AAN8PZP7_PATCE